MQSGHGCPFQRQRLRIDPSFALELGYAVEHGIPWSRYLEEFSSADRGWVIAHTMEQAERCDMCGTASWEWEENRFAYEAVDSLCQGCYLKSVFSDQEGSSLPGTNVKLVPVTPLRKAQRQVAEERRRKMQEKERASDGDGS